MFWITDREEKRDEKPLESWRLIVTGWEVDYRDGGVVTEERTKVLTRGVLLTLAIDTVLPDRPQVTATPFNVQAKPELIVTGAGMVILRVPPLGLPVGRVSPTVKLALWLFIFDDILCVASTNPAV